MDLPLRMNEGKPAMNLKETAEWLAEDASDEEFAEFLILAYKIWNSGDRNTTLTKEDMQNADIEAITSTLKNILDEIIFSDEMDTSCWWKESTEK